MLCFSRCFAELNRARAAYHTGLGANFEWEARRRQLRIEKKNCTLRSGDLWFFLDVFFSVVDIERLERGRWGEL